MLKLKSMKIGVFRLEDVNWAKFTYACYGQTYPISFMDTHGKPCTEKIP